MSDQPIQHLYPEPFAQCYGCGHLNEKGLHVESRVIGDETICHFMPRPEHVAIPGYVYGGLLASIVDCHATGTAAAMATLAAGDPLDRTSIRRFVTARLDVHYLAPTPTEVPLELRGRAVEIQGRKVTVEIAVFAEGVLTVRGRVVCVEAPETFTPAA